VQFTPFMQVICYMRATKIMNAPSIFFSVDRSPAPVVYLGQRYLPKFNSEGEVTFYYTYIRNLYIQWYRGKVVFSNSIHKFWHGWNHSDYDHKEVLMSIELLCEMTGVDWWTASVGKLEWGVNLVKQAMEVVNSMQRYKFKEFLCMEAGGQRYGNKCKMTDYFLKMYDKQFDTWYEIKQSIEPTLRWEVGGNSKYLTKLLGFNPIVNEILTPKSMRIMADHSVELLRTCIRKGKRNLHKLTATQKKIVASMEDNEIREHLKIHNPDTYRNDWKTYQRIMQDPEVCLSDFTDQEVAEKFNQLLA
jgi:hypothetical protein